MTISTLTWKDAQGDSWMAHYLRTSGHLSGQRKRELTAQSIRFYGPLAGSLGMHQFAHWLCSLPTHCGQAVDFSETMLAFAAEAEPAPVKLSFAAGLHQCRRKKMLRLV